MNLIDKYHWKQYNRIASRAGLKKLRFDEWDESLHERESNGRFAPKGGGGSKGNEPTPPKETPKAKEPKPFSHTDTTSYLKALSEAKASLPPEKGAWRVDLPNEEDFKKDHPNAKMHVTSFGSTIAVDQKGDIIAVCRKDKDPVRGKEMLQMAVENGGTKLDSYDGNFGFYVKCGFEPVTWCKWDKRYTPDGWEKGRDNPEDVIFFKFTGKPSKYSSMEEFKNSVEPSKDYDTAFAERDKKMQED